MNLQEFYRLIRLQPQIAAQLEETGRELDLTALAPCLESLLEIQTAPSAYRRLTELLGGDPLQLLYCYLECARRAWEGYVRRGISAEIYADTMRCFPRFLRECQETHGRMYFDRGWWAYRQTSMSLFRLGALEYELSQHDGSPAVALHIPSDADFSPASWDRSLARAGEFFSAHYPEFAFDLYICISWLLSPRLRPPLAGDSNILSFQNRFSILQDDPSDREFVECLFQAPRDRKPERLPAATSLQRGVKDLLLEGGSVGSALGVMPAAC